MKTKIEISAEDRATLNQIKRDRAAVRGWHPGDDSPFQTYSGYTVRDARAHMARIVDDINAKYGIVNRPSAATLQRLQKQADAKAARRKMIEAKVTAKFPTLKAAEAVLWKYELQLHSRPYSGYTMKPDKKEIAFYRRAKAATRRALTKAGFKTVSEAAAVRKAANNYRRQFKTA